MGIILRENFLDELLEQEVTITLKPQSICDNSGSLLVFLLFRHSKILFAEDTHQETALEAEPKPNEQLGAYLSRLPGYLPNEPNVIFKNRLRKS